MRIPSILPHQQKPGVCSCTVECAIGTPKAKARDVAQQTTKLRTVPKTENNLPQMSAVLRLRNPEGKKWAENLY